MNRILYFTLIISFLFSEEYVCSTNLDKFGQEGVEITTYERISTGDYDIFISSSTSSENTYNNLIVTETEEYITLINYLEVPIANLFVTFINKENNTYYQRFLSIDSEYDSDKTVGQCIVRK